MRSAPVLLRLHTHTHTRNNHTRITSWKPLNSFFCCSATTSKSAASSPPTDPEYNYQQQQQKSRKGTLNELHRKYIVFIYLFIYLSNNTNTTTYMTFMASQEQAKSGCSVQNFNRKVWAEEICCVVGSDLPNWHLFVAAFPLSCCVERLHNAVVTLIYKIKAMTHSPASPIVCV